MNRLVVQSLRQVANAQLRMQQRAFSAAAVENKLAPAASGSSAAVEKAKPAQESSSGSGSNSSGGSTFFQRLSSFLAGCGVGFGATFYFLLDQLEESNNKLSKELADIHVALKNKK